MMTAEPARVPVRTILATIGLLLGTGLAVLFVIQVQRVLIWMLVAGFFTVTLYPVVAWVQRRLSWCPRWLATLLVFLLVFLVLGGLLAVFAVADARAGRGPVGERLTRTNALQWVQDNQDRIREFGTGLGAPALSVLRGAGSAVVATVTVFVLSYLGVLEGPRLVDNTLALLEPTRAERIRRVGRDCAITVTGYISGNLLISAICGVLTYAVLKICGVPFSGLIALFVALADLIPMVGATLGAVVAAIAGFVHSVPVGIVVVVFFVVYQQLENHLLQPWIFSRTVKLNPLAVLVAILLAVELAGILGALLAIPVAGMIQVVVRDVWDNRRGRPKQRPTVGADRGPVDPRPGAEPE